MLGLKRRLSKILLLCLMYLLWTYQTSHSDNQRKEKKANLKKFVETVHANEMRIVMWKRGLKSFQDWMRNPPPARVSFENSATNYFDLSSCDLELEDGVHTLGYQDLKNCDNPGNISQANFTVIDGVVTGLATLKLPDDRICELVYQRGVLHGMQRIFNTCLQTEPRGERCLEIIGWFNTGQPSSRFLHFLYGGGALIGELDHNFKVSGSGLYIFPDWHTALVGEWEGGKMVSGVEGEDRGMQFVDKMPSFQVEITGKKKFHYDPGTETRISSNPGLEDPMEKKNVKVKSSLISGAGEGLFAVKPFSSGQIAAFYSGIQIDRARADGASSYKIGNYWSQENIIIDIPEGFRETTQYKASLAHKVNHQYKNPNLKFTPCQHPRFGDIICVVAARRIFEGEELTVNYYQDYKGEDTPGYALKQLLKVMDLKLDWDQRAIIEDYTRHLQDFVDSNNMRENLTEAIIGGLVKHNRKESKNRKDVVDIVSLLKRLEKKPTRE